MGGWKWKAIFLFFKDVLGFFGAIFFLFFVIRWIEGGRVVFGGMYVSADAGNGDRI